MKEALEVLKDMYSTFTLFIERMPLEDWFTDKTRPSFVSHTRIPIVRPPDDLIGEPIEATLHARHFPSQQSAESLFLSVSDPPTTDFLDKS